MRSALPALVAALGLTACASGPAGDGDAARVREEIVAATASFERAQAERDVAALVALLHDEFTMLQDGVRLGREDVVAQIEATMPSLRRLEPSFQDVRAFALDRDAGVTSFGFVDRMIDAEGREARTSGSTTLVWRRTAGGWRILFADADHRGS